MGPGIPSALPLMFPETLWGDRLHETVAPCGAAGSTSPGGLKSLSRIFLSMDLIALFAGLSVVVAIVTVSVEMKRHRNRAEARMSASAFLLRLQLESWIADHDWEKAAKSDDGRAKLGSMLVPHFDTAEKRATALLEEVGSASSGKARQAEYAAALFFATTSRINVFCWATVQPENRKAATRTVGPFNVLGTRADVGDRLRHDFDDIPELLRLCNNTLRTLISRDLDVDAAIAKSRGTYPDDGNSTTEP